MKDVTNDFGMAKTLLESLDDEKIKKDLLQKKAPVEQQVQETLWEYMSSIFKHAQEDYDFKIFIQELIKERISGGTLEHMLALYYSLNRHEESSTTVNLAPFMPGKNAEGSPLLNEMQQGAAAPAEIDVHKRADAETLRAFDQLSNLLGKMSQKNIEGPSDNEKED